MRGEREEREGGRREGEGVKKMQMGFIFRLSQESRAGQSSSSSSRDGSEKKNRKI